MLSAALIDQFINAVSQHALDCVLGTTPEEIRRAEQGLRDAKQWLWKMNITEYAEGFWTITEYRAIFPGSCRSWRSRLIYQGRNLEGHRAWWVYHGKDFRGVVLAS